MLRRAVTRPIRPISTSGSRMWTLTRMPNIRPNGIDQVIGSRIESSRSAAVAAGRPEFYHPPDGTRQRRIYDLPHRRIRHGP